MSASPRHHHRRPRLPGAPGLALRQFTADPWVSVLLALMVVVVTFAATLWPRFVLDMNGDQVPHEVNELSASRQDMVGHSSATVQPGASATAGSVEGTWGSVIERLEQVRQEQPEPLRSVLQPAQFLAELDPAQEVEPPGADSDVSSVTIQQRIDPYLQEHVELVEGDWPELVVNADAGLVTPETETGAPGDVETPGAEPVPVLLLDSAAERLGWGVGEEHEGWVLSGTYRPLDPDDGRWEHHVNGATLGTIFDGNRGLLAFATAYLSPANPGTTGTPSVVSLELWFPIDASAVAGDEVDEVTAQVLGIASADHVLREEDPATGATLVSTRFSSEVVGTFQELAAQQRATASMLAVVAAGPVGVTLAVFALSARLIVSRRRFALALATARGGSPRQVRGLLAAEGLLLGIPAAALGYYLAGLVQPVSTGWPEWVVAGLAALVPAAALALSAGEQSLREQRRDLGSHSASRVRWILEAVVLALAAVAVWRLLDRGLTGVGTSDAASGGPPGPAPEAVAVQVDTGVDLLMAATPVLLALAACVLTLRLYPVPVHALTGLFRRRRGLTPFLGAARSVRDPAGGLVPALAVILGVGVAVFSALMSSTINHGAEAAAWNETGAQIRLSGPNFSAEMMTQLAAVDGVGAVAGARQAGRTAELGGDSSESVSVYVVDSSIRDVQAASPLVEPLPDELFTPGSATPVVTGGELEVDPGEASLSTLGPVQVVGHVDQLPGVRTDSRFVVVDRTLWEQAGGATLPATVALVSAADPAEREQVAAAVGEQIGNALVETPQQALDGFREAPVTAGLTTLFSAAVAGTTVLTVLAILVVQLMGAPARIALLAVLRTLGLQRRQGRALTAWELGPLLAMAFVVGAVLGVAIPWLLTRAVDLTGMTGGPVQPALHLDWGLLGLVVGVILVAVVLAVTVSAAVASRADLAQQLRVGEER